MDSKPQELQAIPPQYINAYSVDDEISLVDVWISFARFKKLFFVSFFFVFASGILLASFWIKEKHQMSSIISTGMITVGADRQPIESPAAIVAELNRSVMPELTNKYAETYGTGLFRTTIKNPTGTNLIVIENRVGGDRQTVIEKFQKEIVAHVVGNHAKLYDAMNASMKRRLADEKKSLIENMNPLKLDKLTENQRLSLQREKHELDKLSDKSVRESNRQAIRDKIKIAEESIKALMDQNSALLQQVNQAGSSGLSKDKGDVRINISENRLAINEFQNQVILLKQSLERFDIELEQEIVNKKTQIEALETTIKLIGDDLNDQIALQKEKISSLELQFTNDGTRATAIAELSLLPVGLTRTKAFVLIFILSIFFAFAITVIAIFRQKVREKLAEGT